MPTSCMVRRVAWEHMPGPTHFTWWCGSLQATPKRPQQPQALLGRQMLLSPLRLLTQLLRALPVATSSLQGPAMPLR